MKVLRNATITAACILAFVSLAKGDGEGPTLTLDPTNGAIQGPAGTDVGWGYTLTAGSDFAVITGSQFCTGPISSPCTNPFGTYTDNIGNAFIVVGPAAGESTVSQAWSAGNGVGDFLINAASTGTISGEIVLSYDVYSVDPNSANFDPISDLLFTGLYAEDGASVTVGPASTSGGGGNTVPEPGTPALLLAGLACLALVTMRTKPAARTQA
ncbi:MAG: PEP-CTERM sorting domain-containing protein [Candidatus Acidiferrales bacterium]